jgi:hypothetical protein
MNKEAMVARRVAAGFFQIQGVRQRLNRCQQPGLLHRTQPTTIAIGPPSSNTQVARGRPGQRTSINGSSTIACHANFFPFMSVANSRG